MIKDIRPGPQGSGTGLLASVNGLAFFVASDGSGSELWKTDGTANGTVPVKNINPTGGIHINEAVAYNGQLIFTVNDRVNGYELWRSDGTAAGTVMVKDIRLNDLSLQDPNTLDIVDLTVVNGSVYFKAIDDVSGWALWKSDGTPAGTVKVKDFHKGNEHIHLLEPLGNELLTLVSDQAYNNFALWKSDGTTAGTVKVKSFGFADHQRLVESEVMNDALYFNIEGRVLWRTDGTECGTYTIGYEDPYNFTSLPYNLTAVGSTLFFTGNANDIGNELFKLDESDVPPAPCLSARSSEASSAREAVGDDEMMSFMDMTVSNYPNPFQGDFTLRIDGPDDGSYEASLIQMNGMMAEQRSGLKCNTGYSLGSGLTNGIYILKVKMDDRIRTRRVVKIN
jgi:ELWxxDGT repeat protein